MNRFSKLIDNLFEKLCFKNVFEGQPKFKIIRTYHPTDNFEMFNVKKLMFENFYHTYTETFSSLKEAEDFVESITRRQKFNSELKQDVVKTFE